MSSERRKQTFKHGIDGRVPCASGKKVIKFEKKRGGQTLSVSEVVKRGGYLPMMMRVES
jgi:hypothetical protein